MRIYRTEGIIIKRKNFGEADKILTVFTKHWGKIQVLAKGVRKVTSRKGGNLEIFNWVGVVVSEGKNLDIIREVEIKDPFPGFRKDLRRIGLAYCFAELVDNLCPLRQENKAVFALLIDFFRALERQKGDLGQFEVRLLEALGFWPRSKSIAKEELERYLYQLMGRKLKSKETLKRFWFCDIKGEI